MCFPLRSKLHIILSVVVVLSVTLSIFFSVNSLSHHVSAASPPPETLAEYIPSAVTSGQAHLLGHHQGTDQLALTIGLPLRNVQALTQLLNEVSAPRMPQYRHYLTLTQENQAFNPTSQQEQQVIDWLQANGLTVNHTYPNHLLVDALGTFAQVERLLHITLNDYTALLGGETVAFYAPATEPTVPASVRGLVNSIVGLDNFSQMQTENAAALAPFTNGKANGQPPYYPQDFANAYDVNPLWNLGDTGSNQHIAITLWGTPPTDITLNKFGQDTGANVATRANGRLQVIQVPCPSGCVYKTQGGLEAALDVEYSSGMAPGATIDYYQIPTDKFGNPTDSGFLDALNLAGSNGNDTQISNSWVRECETQDAFTTSLESIFKANTATGHDYFFGSGDNGSACVSFPKAPCLNVQDPYPAYPASSAYVTSVGGTNLAIQNNSWQTEIAWDYSFNACTKLHFGTPPKGSGGGYSNLFPEPTWQSGISDPNNQRGYPDVAADGDPTTGAYICYDGKKSPTCVKKAGTSLATPLWAGMIADVNQYVQSQGQAPLGFLNPLLYTLANGSPFPAYHDVTIGTNGTYNAGPGWDAVTGLGSPDLFNLAQDAVTGLNTSNTPNDQLNGIATVTASDVWAVGESHRFSTNPQTLIEHWNGSNWSVVSSPSPGVFNQLNGVAAVSANDVWAVGGFGPLIEHWDGTSWSVVPSANPGGGDELNGVAAVSANDVWAVGSAAGAPLIEHWDGRTWTVVPSASLTGSSSTVFFGVAAISSSDVWAVGYANSQAVNSYTLIEHWDGSTWSIVSSPNSSVDDRLSNVAAISSSDVWAVGDYLDSNLNEYPLAEHWDGSTWSIVSSPNPTGSQNLFSGIAAISSSDVWAVGRNYGVPMVQHWGGTGWSVVPSPAPGICCFPNELLGVAAISSNDVWAVGDYANSSGTSIGSFTLIEHWDGSTWSVVSSLSP